ncbi:hypothetical protein E2C01_002671 [Portunus trituberculatus]|uniref:Uncharacterized protein n=1 Tax=Portunus trituberculatus TaxID=210409 RepID=A0A5B7CNU8_PORTR|nr:hypothetical protein [Portunus trituberculatus]
MKTQRNSEQLPPKPVEKQKDADTSQSVPSLNPQEVRRKRTLPTTSQTAVHTPPATLGIHQGGIPEVFTAALQRASSPNAL